MTSTERAQPAYQRIAAEWAEKIDRGELRHGDRLPTRPEMEERYGVSRQVIRDALTLLHQDGYLTSAPAKGTFVYRLPRLELPMWSLEREGGKDSFEDAVREQDHDPEQHISVETIEPEADIRAMLDLAEGELALVRRRVRTVDQRPYMIADSYYPYAVVANTEIASPANITRGARHVLIDLGLAMRQHRDTITSRRPHTREVADLDIAPGLSVICHDRLSRTEEGRPIRLLRSVLPSDRWAVTYEVV